jgi:ketosteroid isomerase-like protein
MFQRHIALAILIPAALLGTGGGLAHAARAAYPCDDEAPHCGSAPATSLPRTPRAMVTAYFDALTVGRASGDYAALGALFASGATVTRHDGQGRSTTVRGRAQIVRLYRQVLSNEATAQWTQDATYLLSPTVILTYEHAIGLRLRAPQRSSHLFVVRDGKVARLIETTY